MSTRHYKGLALHRRVIVALTTGRSFRGVLLEVHPDLLVLRNAELLEDERVIGVDGAVVLERRSVEFVQVVS